VLSAGFEVVVLNRGSPLFALGSYGMYLSILIPLDVTDFGDAVLEMSMIT